MRAPRIALSALALATAAACASRPVETTSTGGVAPSPATSPTADMSGMPHFSATLAPVNGSGISGTAMIHGMNGRQMVELSINGAPASATLPWHVHSGSCADGMTPIVGDPANYTALGTSNDGTARIMADLPINFVAGQKYHVNVHKSPTEMGTIVACGDIS
ncbi:MAG: hypothetical protein HOQ34_07905 [Gemmatimonadaceae bacterium]|nr:hypothetical protein [Gemmatimonadaceae bacterium]